MYIFLCVLIMKQFNKTQKKMWYICLVSLIISAVGIQTLLIYVDKSYKKSLKVCHIGQLQRKRSLAKLLHRNGKENEKKMQYTSLITEMLKTISFCCITLLSIFFPFQASQASFLFLQGSVFLISPPFFFASFCAGSISDCMRPSPPSRPLRHIGAFYKKTIVII